MVSQLCLRHMVSMLYCTVWEICRKGGSVKTHFGGRIEMAKRSRNNYAAALKQAEAELARHEELGEALARTVEALRNLLVLAPAKPPRGKRRRRKTIKVDHPPIPPGHFKGMGATAAYRKFVAEFGTDYPAPSIRDALLAGDVKTTSPSTLLTGLHAVRRRDAQRLQRDAMKGSRVAERAAEQAEETSE